MSTENELRILMAGAPIAERTLIINMDTYYELQNHLWEFHGGFERIAIRRGGIDHVYNADEIISLLEEYEIEGDGCDTRAFFGPRLKEEIVRCKDCRHYRPHEWVVATDVDHVCHFWHGEPTKVAPDGFCAWAERRNG